MGMQGRTPGGMGGMQYGQQVGNVFLLILLFRSLSLTLSLALFLDHHTLCHHTSMQSRLKWVC
jgi:hypothetical protein